MDPVCFPITFRGKEGLSLGSQRAKERQKERKERSRVEGCEEERASGPEVFYSQIHAGSTPHFPFRDLKSFLFPLGLTNSDSVKVRKWK